VSSEFLAHWHQAISLLHFLKARRLTAFLNDSNRPKELGLWL
jgi:hypothetical protein